MAWAIGASAMANGAALGRVWRADADVHWSLLQNRIGLEWFQKNWVPEESADACAPMRPCHPPPRLYPARHTDRPNLLRRGSTASVITVPSSLKAPLWSIMLPVAALAGVQALVAGSLFAVPTVAPAVAADLGLEPSALVGTYMAVVFVLGILSSPGGGDLVLRLGALRVSQL